MDINKILLLTSLMPLVFFVLSFLCYAYYLEKKGLRGDVIVFKIKKSKVKEAGKKQSA